MSALKKNIDALVKSIHKSEAQKGGWQAIDKIQSFLIKHKKDLSAHPKQLARISEIQRRQAQQIALNLHRLSKSVCVNLDEDTPIKLHKTKIWKQKLKQPHDLHQIEG